MATAASPPSGYRRGLNVTSRAHRACTACRRQKMRCEGLDNDACTRCQRLELECVFELPPLRRRSKSAEQSAAGTLAEDAASAQASSRLTTLEAQLADMQAMMRQMLAANAAGQQSATATAAAATTTITTPTGQYDATVADGDGNGRWADMLLGNISAPPPHKRRDGSRHGSSSSKRARLSSTVIDSGDLPEEGLGAPIKTLRSLAEAAHRTPKVGVSANGNRAAAIRAPFLFKSTATSRATSPVEPQRRSDAVSKGTIAEHEARRLWGVFSQGCPRFIAACFVQDDDDEDADDGYDDDGDEKDTFSLTRTTSPFLFVVILAIGAQIDSARYGEHPAYQACCQQAQGYAQRTLLQHAPQLRVEDVMALNLMASYCDYGWLLSGHAVRIAQELCLDSYFRQLMQRVDNEPALLAVARGRPTHSSMSAAGRPTHSPMSAAAGRPAHSSMSSADDDNDDVDRDVRHLAMGARVWFFSFLLEHQISYGAGRSAMLQHRQVEGCRDFLRIRAPYVTHIDARFVATLELMVLRERHMHCLAPFDQPLSETMLANVHALNEDLHDWIEYWSADLRRRGHADGSFWMASLRLQCATAKLYLTSTSLRKAGLAHDESGRWQSMSAWRRDLVVQSAKAASEALRIAVTNKEYFDLLTWAPHYTIVTVTFSAVFLLKAMRLFPPRHLLPAQALEDVVEHSQALATRLYGIASASKFGTVVTKMLSRYVGASNAGRTTTSMDSSIRQSLFDAGRVSGRTSMPPNVAARRPSVANGFAPLSLSSYNSVPLQPAPPRMAFSGPGDLSVELPPTSPDRNDFSTFDQILRELELDDQDHFGDIFGGGGGEGNTGVFY